MAQEDSGSVWSIRTYQKNYIIIITIIEGLLGSSPLQPPCYATSKPHARFILWNTKIPNRIVTVYPVLSHPVLCETLLDIHLIRIAILKFTCGHTILLWFTPCSCHPYIFFYTSCSPSDLATGGPKGFFLKGFRMGRGWQIIPAHYQHSVRR